MDNISIDMSRVMGNTHSLGKAVGVCDLILDLILVLILDPDLILDLVFVHVLVRFPFA